MAYPNCFLSRYLYATVHFRVTSIILSLQGSVLVAAAVPLSNTGILRPTRNMNAATGPPPPPPPSSSACFPSLAKVNFENGPSKAMSELQVGDRVQTGLNI